MNPLLTGLLLVIGIGIMSSDQMGIIDLYGDNSNTDYEPVVLTPEEQAQQLETSLKIFRIISFTMLLISLALLGVSPWFFWGLTAGILWSK